jgi:threonine dehydratase
VELPTLEDIERAAELLHAVVPPTAQIEWPLLSARTGARVWVKHENHTRLGAFKVRGGLIYMAELLKRNPRVTGVIAATRGNHGQSVAFAAARHGLRAIIVVPHGNSREKNAAMRALGAELIEHGTDFSEALEYARELAVIRQLELVPSFDHTLVRGVATYALELCRAVPDLDAIYVPIGMGSGICGTIAVREALRLKTEVIGVVAEGAPAYAQSLAAGEPVVSGAVQTMADGMAVRVPNEEAFRIIREHAARLVTVNDAQIQDAMRMLFTDTHNMAEGAGAAALAGLVREAGRQRDHRVAVVLTGANIDRELYLAAVSCGASPILRDTH